MKSAGQVACAWLLRESTVTTALLVISFIMASDSESNPDRSQTRECVPPLPELAQIALHIGIEMIASEIDLLGQVVLPERQIAQQAASNRDVVQTPQHILERGKGIEQGSIFLA